MASSRYLTAPKISLLILARLYCRSELPYSATLPILSFILSHTVPAVACSARAHRDSDSNVCSFSIHTFEDVLQGHLSNMPGRTLLDMFLKHMWEVNSFDALHDLFDSLGDVFVKPKDDACADTSTKDYQSRTYLSKMSPLGAFIRRARLEFTRLQFDDAMKLWSSFIKYRAPTASWSKRIAGLASIGIDVTAAEMGLKPGADLYEVAYGHLAEESQNQVLSTDDLERLLDFQLDRLQRLGCRVPDDMRPQLQNMFGSSGVLLRQAHLVKFFDAWKAGDYTSAFDDLHRYYDYIMQTREKIPYHYALLHMAILQADFGCFREAIAAINETITTARESQDIPCLNFSLSWLTHMSKAYPKQMKSAGYMSMLGSERDGLVFMKGKAKEMKMHNLLSTTLLNEAKLCLATGESIPRAFEYMIQSSYVDIRENVHNHGSQMLLQSALYSRLGVMHLSTVHCDLLLHCYSQGCPIDECIRAVVRRAFVAAECGEYERGIGLLGSIQTSTYRSLKANQYRILCTGLIKIKRAIQWADWEACDALLTSLQPESSTDPEISFLLSKSWIEYLVARGQFSKAFAQVEALSKSLRNENADVLQRVSVLLLKANLFRKIGKPEQGFTPALRAASVAFKARLMPCLWWAIELLSSVLNSIGEFGAARRLLHAIIPQSLENDDYTLTATLYSQLGDSFIGLAGLEESSTTQDLRLRAAKISQAEVCVDRAREGYKRVENMHGECEQLMKKAMIAKLRGDEKLAEEWAQNHNRRWEEGSRRVTYAVTHTSW